jgi:hypothetical protein
MKFTAHQDRFLNEQSQIIYSLSLLEKNVVLMVAPLLEIGVLPCEKIDDLVILRETLYGKPTAKPLPSAN